VAANVIDLNVDEVAGTPEVDEVDREQLAAALTELPDEFRLVVLMFYFEELSYQEIAESLDIPIGTVMSRLSRAKGHLRQRLSAGAANAAAGPSPPNGRAAATERESAVGRMTGVRVRR
jgi:RNA polymerase sigma-70 factor (ECF subfamily)